MPPDKERLATTPGGPTTQEQAIALAEEILADLELGRIPLSNVAMKCARLARMTGDEPALRWLLLEIGGYGGKLDEEGFQFAWEAGRGLQETLDKAYHERRVWPDSIATMEATTETLREELSHLVIPPLTEGSPASGGVYAAPGAGLVAVGRSKDQGAQPVNSPYGALSEGLHDRTDAECLELASDVRVVLTELADRIGQALKDERELQDAVTRLLTRESGGGSNEASEPA